MMMLRSRIFMKMIKINEKTNSKSNIKILFVFIMIKKVILNLIVRIKINRLFMSSLL